MERPFPAYKGDEPYIFVSYAHTNNSLVYPELRRLDGLGYNIWYDEGINPGHDWHEELAFAIQGCSVQLFFITPESVQSKPCLRETNYAIDHDKNFLAVHLTETELPAGLALEIGDSQAILKYESSDEAYQDKLDDALHQFVSPTSSPTITSRETNLPSREKRRGLNLAGLLGLIAMAILATVLFLNLPDEEIEPMVEPMFSENLTVQLTTLSESENYFQAFLLAQDQPLEQSELNKFSLPGSLVTEPDGASVSIRHLSGDKDDWLSIGITPIDKQRFPLGAMEVRIQKPNFRTLQFTLINPSLTLDNYRYAVDSPLIPLVGEDQYPDEMVFVPAGKFVPNISGFEVGFQAIISHGDFLIDRYEVTNSEFLAFVSAGGYTNEEYWRDLEFVEDGHRVDLDVAMSRFMDATGRLGPATWELGTFSPGTGHLPVGGVSWYEAVAYARFANKTLPNIYHWTRAAYTSYGGGIGVGQTIAQFIIPQSNLNGESVQSPGEVNSIGAYGTYDQAGNVREWLWNSSGSNRFILGGSWDDELYMGSLMLAVPPMNRTAGNGFRLSMPLDKADNKLTAVIETNAKTPEDYLPVTDEIYAVLREQFNYTHGDLDPRIVSSDREVEGHVWDTISLKAAYDEERFQVHVLKPTSGPIKGTVVFFPGINSFFSKTEVPAGLLAFFGFSPTGGYNFIMPEYFGSHQRYPEKHEAYWVKNNNFKDWLLKWHSDMGRTLDYLESEPEKFGDQFFFMGVSYGASAALPLLALEDRFQAAILMLGGIATVNHTLALTETVNYIPRITLPVLFIGATLDPVFPVNISQKPFLKLLGTPKSQVRFVPYEAAHALPARHVWVRESMDWIEAYTEQKAR